MEFSACPRCASPDIHGAGIADGAWGGVGPMVHACRSCLFRGQPLLFADPEDYAAFREAVARGEDVGTDPAEGEDDNGVGDEAPDEELRWAAEGPGLSTGSPTTAIVIGALAVTGLAVGTPLLLMQALALPLAPFAGLLRFAGNLMMLVFFGVWVMVCLAGLRVARRLWRGAPSP